jgi:thiamine-phosphate pyrophosphorylase
MKEQKRSLLNEMTFYLVTDSDLSTKGTLSDVKKAVDSGCKIVQYREKGRSTKEMVAEALQIKELCGDNAIFLVNDRIDVALAVDADGVHIGQNDIHIDTARELLGTSKIIGISTHNVEQAIAAEKSGADYIGLGPIFNTSTKKDAGDGIGYDIIKKVKDAVNVPVVAIGGIDKGNCLPLIECGVDALVAISAVVCSDDVGKETADFIELIRVKRAI